ncbi:mycoides cluster lipoprotein, LppA/P72 family [Mesomycoplasma ovipneumoniae]|nr:mycoides cluster lipoprotein, LppA/P72 family [Mesomycoplasma ovipneumoniae]
MKRIYPKKWFLGSLTVLIPTFFIAAACGQNNGDKNKEDNKNNKSDTIEKPNPPKENPNPPKGGTDVQGDPVAFLDTQKGKIESDTLKLIEETKKQKENIEKTEEQTKQIEEKQAEIIKELDKIQQNQSSTDEQKSDKISEDIKKEKEKLEIEKEKLEKQKKEQAEKLLKEKERLSKLEEEKRQKELEKQKIILEKNRLHIQTVNDLNAVLAKIPNSLEIAEQEKRASNNVATVLHHYKQKPSSFHYENFVKKIDNFDDQNYTITFSFPFEVKTVENNNDINQRRLENVELSVSKKGADTKVTKRVNLFWDLEKSKQIQQNEEPELYQKDLRPVFSKISPSILAYALVNSENEAVLNSVLFGDFNAAFSEVSLSVGLKDEFLGIKSLNDEEKFSFDIISATPDDENGTLKIKVKKTKFKEQKEQIGDLQEFTFSNLKKNNKSVAEFEFEVDSHKVWPQIRDKRIFKDNKHNKDQLSEIQKGLIAKIIFDSLYFKIKNPDPEVLLKEFLVKDHIKNNNFFPYPQIISLEWDGMIRNDAHKKIALKLENKKLIYSFELKYANLLPNSTITPQDQTLQFSDYKTAEIKGEIPLDQFLI